MPPLKGEAGETDDDFILRLPPYPVVRFPEPSEPRDVISRVPYLDWLRLLLVWIVVFGHIQGCGVDKLLKNVQVDNHAYADYAGDGEAKSGLDVRWICVLRQWTLPLLFWVSGASAACSFRGSVKCSSIRKVLVATFVGMGSNAALWALGPRDPECGPSDACVGRGILFDFTVVPRSGVVAPIVFQMWYAMALLVYMALNAPLCSVLYGNAHRCGIVAQWVLTSALWLWGVSSAAASGECTKTWLVAAWLIVGEAAFLVLATLAAPMLRPVWLPPRVIHYALAAVTLVQFGAAPIADELKGTASPAFALYAGVGFHRFYGLGFVMLHTRLHDHDGRAVLSRVWPAFVIPLVCFTPSTNWYSTGNLTYPFYPDVVDRALFVAGSLTCVFAVDCAGRNMLCEPFPAALNFGTLLLYLAHPVLISVCIQAGIRNTFWIWHTVTLSAILISFSRQAIRSACEPKPGALYQRLR